MRIGAITGSVVLHTALFAAAMALPTSAPPKRAPDPITFDLFTPEKKAETPPEPKPEPPPEPPKVAMREPTPAERERVLQPPTATPEPVTPKATEPPAASGNEHPSTKVDLTLHALPSGGSDNAVTLPSGAGSFGTTLGSNDGGGKKPWKMRGDAGNPLTGKLADEKEDRFPLKPIGGGEYMYKGKAFNARIARDGRVSFDDKSIRDFKGLSGGFDVTDLLMRAKGNDPYRHEKQAFMDQTEAMRKKMAQTVLKERVQESVAQIPNRLHQIWRDPRISVVERRRLIYETWKDAAESDSTVDSAGAEACATIEAFVRRYLPAGSDDAYTDEELQRFNRGQKLAFAPYR